MNNVSQELHLETQTRCIIKLYVFILQISNRKNEENTSYET